MNQSIPNVKPQITLVDIPDESNSLISGFSSLPVENFLMEVFKESNSHIRDTDKKSITVTCAYIALCSILWGGFLRLGGDLQSISGSWQFLFFLIFLLGMGLVVFSMQQWYRAWKNHYIEVCHEIREKFMPILTEDSEKALPYWIRKKIPVNRFSIDNLFMYSTFLINAIICIAVFIELQALQPRYATILMFILTGSYLSVLYIIRENIKTKFLIA